MRCPACAPPPVLHEECCSAGALCRFSPTAFKTLKDAHIKVGQMATEQGVRKLQDNFHEYHEKYEEKRASWKPIPAEELARVIFKKFIGPTTDKNLRIIDFGCGDVGLFECALAQLLETRDAKGLIDVLALDVVPLSCAAALTASGSKPKDGLDDKHTTFVCSTQAGDYTSIADKESYQQSFDVGVCCLSFMMSDALEVGLVTASLVVKPAGTIYVVLDTWKCGIHANMSIHNQTKELKEWCDEFTARTGFKVTDKWVQGSPRFVYLELRNVGIDEVDGIKEKLSGVTLKSIRETPAPTPDDRVIPPAVRSSEAGPSGAKRSLSGAEGSLSKAAREA